MRPQTRQRTHIGLIRCGTQTPVFVPRISHCAATRPSPAGAALTISIVRSGKAAKRVPARAAMAGSSWDGDARVGRYG
jgi:hypothetical protein